MPPTSVVVPRVPLASDVPSLGVVVMTPVVPLDSSFCALTGPMFVTVV
jgi:hypothetical protein